LSEIRNGRKQLIFFPDEIENRYFTNDALVLHLLV
jgi:hypothetical protein